MEATQTLRHCSTVTPDVVHIAGIADQTLREIVDFAAACFGNTRTNYFDWSVAPYGTNCVKVTLHKN